MSPAASIAPDPADAKAAESSTCTNSRNIDLDRAIHAPNETIKKSVAATDEDTTMILPSALEKDMTSNYACPSSDNDDQQPDLCELESSSTADHDDDHDDDHDNSNNDDSNNNDNKDDGISPAEDISKHVVRKKDTEHDMVASGDSVKASPSITSFAHTDNEDDDKDDVDECEDTKENDADNATSDAVDESVGGESSDRIKGGDDETATELETKPPAVILLPSSDEDTDNANVDDSKVGNSNATRSEEVDECQRKKPTRLADPSSSTLKKTLVDSDRMRTIHHEGDDDSSCGGESSAWMHLRSSSLQGDDINILPVPVRISNGRTASNGVANTAEVSDTPPVQAVAAPTTTGDVITADIVYPVPVPSAPPPTTPSAAQDVPLPSAARESSSSASASESGDVAFPDLLQREDTTNRGNRTDAWRQDKQDQHATDANGFGSDWLRDDVAIARELDNANRRQQPGADALRRSVEAVRQSAERGSIAKARHAATLSMTSVDAAMGRLLRDGKTVARKGDSSATQPLSSLAIETEAGPLLSRTHLPSRIRYNHQTQQWVASIQTNQKALEKHMDVRAARGVVTMSFDCQGEASAAVDAFAPPRNLPFKDSPVCFICMTGFKVWKRAGHCRNCGVCVCSKCSTTWPSDGLPSTYNIKRENMVRVCNTCDWLSTSFRTALFTGDQDKAVAIYSTGNVNLRSPFVNCKGETLFPVHCAAMGGSTAVLKWLVDECYCPITSSTSGGKRKSGIANTLVPLLTSKGRSILDIAICSQNVDMLRYVVVQKDISVLGIKDMKAALLSLDAVLRRLPDESSRENETMGDAPLGNPQSQEISTTSSDRDDSPLPIEQHDDTEIGAMAHLSHYEEMPRSQSYKCSSVPARI